MLVLRGMAYIFETAPSELEMDAECFKLRRAMVVQDHDSDINLLNQTRYQY
jgi:hypothetical protein